MKYLLAFLFPTLAFSASAVSALTNETLHYNISWPSGLSLGEATLTASTSGSGKAPDGGMHFGFDLDASVPGFAVSDRFRSAVSPMFCSLEFEKKILQGSKKVDDKETFDVDTGTVTRGEGSGQSEITSNACGKDALAFLYFVRRELSQGRIPPGQTIFFGAPYEIRLDSAGAESVKIANKMVDAEHVKASVTGPSSNISFDLFFLKDPARTLALVRVPLALGTFSMELTK